MSEERSEGAPGCGGGICDVEDLDCLVGGEDVFGMVPVLFILGASLVRGRKMSSRIRPT